jgi:hypothetical protein
MDHEPDEEEDEDEPTGGGRGDDLEVGGSTGRKRLDEPEGGSEAPWRESDCTGGVAPVEGDDATAAGVV